MSSSTINIISVYGTLYYSKTELSGLKNREEGERAEGGDLFFIVIIHFCNLSFSPSLFLFMWCSLDSLSLKTLKILGGASPPPKIAQGWARPPRPPL